MSFARTLFAAIAAPTYFKQFADDSVNIRYRFGDLYKDCIGVKREERTEFLQSESGTIEKRILTSIVLGTDEFSALGGVADPQLKGTFDITDSWGNVTSWAVHSADGINAIEGKTDNLVVINLIRTRAASVSSRDYRR